MGVVLFKAAFHGKSPFPSQAGKGLSTPYKEIGQQKSAVSESLPRRRFSVVDQSEHFTAKPPLKK